VEKWYAMVHTYKPNQQKRTDTNNTYLSANASGVLAMFKK